MLIFNKQFRTEEKIISELIKKIKKSEKFVQSWDDLEEVYDLDTIKIGFISMQPKELKVYDKSGKEILSMGCEYQSGNEMQEVRANWFHELLERARKRDQKEKDKKQMRKATATIKAKKQSKAKEAAMMKALEQIKSL